MFQTLSSSSEDLFLAFIVNIVLMEGGFFLIPGFVPVNIQLELIVQTRLMTTCNSIYIYIYIYIYI